MIPVYNEQRVLAESLRRLHGFLSNECDFTFRITIADNGSADATPAIARTLSREFDDVRVLRLARKGRGLALRSAWSVSEAEVLAYMDVDLSTDLRALPELLRPLLNGTGDLAIGSRLAPGAVVRRGFKRELISRGYNVLLRWLLGVGFSDAQCGFKAGRREVIQALLPRIHNENWFFDTELLYLGQRSRFSIHEVPVRWIDDPDSRVDLLATAREDLLGIRRLRAASRNGDRPAEPGLADPVRATGRTGRSAGAKEPLSPSRWRLAPELGDGDLLRPYRRGERAPCL